jgi:hypothetical protein
MEGEKERKKKKKEKKKEKRRRISEMGLKCIYSLNRVLKCRK